MVRIMWQLLLLSCLAVGVPTGRHKSVDDNLTDALDDAHVEVKPVIELPNGEYLLGLDEDLTEEQYNDLFGHHKTRSKSRVAIRAAAVKDRRWTGALVPYAFDRFGEKKDVVTSAMKELMEGTCLKFKLKGKDDYNYVSFVNKDGCWSSLGMKGKGKQELSLGYRGCRNRDTTLHEILHAIGVIHEQERPDRDDFVILQWENMKPGPRPNYERVEKHKVNYYGVPYDFSSVMHYSLRANSRNRKHLYTMIPYGNENAYKYVERSTEYGLSFGDYKLVNRMYKCGEKCKIKCPEPGYVTKECKCMTKTLFYKKHCKGDEDSGWCLKFKIEGDVDDHLPPDSETEDGNGDNGGKDKVKPKPCLDVYSGCLSWKKKGYCEKSHSMHDFVKTRCQKSCKFC